MENPVNKEVNDLLRKLYKDREDVGFARGENYAYTTIYNALTHGKVVRIMGKRIVFAEENNK